MGLEHEVVELRRRIEVLEGRLGAMETAAVPVGPGPATPPPPFPAHGLPVGQPFPAQAGPVGQPTAAWPPPPQVPGPQPAAARAAAWPPPAAPPGTPARPSIEPEALIKWVGVGLVVLAAIFFVSTAISRGWIGPELQLLGATLVGLGLLGGAFHFERRSTAWSTVLAIGAGIVLPTCAAATTAALDLLSAPSAVALLSITVVVLVAAAVRLRLEAVATVVGLVALPLLIWIGDGDGSYLAATLWYTALVVGFTAVLVQRRWGIGRAIVIPVAAVFIWSVAIGSDTVDATTSDQVLLILATAVVALAVWIAPAIVDRLDVEPSRSPDEPGAARALQQALNHRVVLALPLWTWAVLLGFLDLGSERGAVLGLALACGFAVAAVAARPVIADRLSTSHLLGAVVLLAPSLIMLLGNGGLLLAALAAQAAATGFLARRLDDGWLLGFALLLGIGVVPWATGMMLVGLDEPLDLGWHAATGFVVLLVVGASIVFHQDQRVDDGVARLLGVVAWVLGLLWIATFFIHGPQGQVVISALWAVAAATAIVAGVRLDDGLVRSIGLGTLTLVVAKLLTVDLAEIDTLWRVGLFFVIGIGLLWLGYLLPRLADSGHRAAAETPTQPPLR